MQKHAACGVGFALACLAFVTALGRSPGDVLTVSTASPDAPRELLLRRQGQRLLLVDDRSQRVVASAPAATTTGVVIRGAAGSHDDCLRVDLSEPFQLPEGITYDGGAGGWDTLELTGAGTRGRHVVTQLSPHDGVIDLDGLVVRYLNLEPVTDVIPAASLTINGTGDDTMTLSDGPGVGEATLSSPTFESYTFTNKTQLVINGNGGTDSLVFANPTPATGLTSVLVTDVDTVTQNQPIVYSSFGVNTGGALSLTNAGNDVDSFEATTTAGSISFVDSDGLSIGGVSASLAGITAGGSGGVTVVSGGTISLADTDGPQSIASGPSGGDISLDAQGATSDITSVVVTDALSSPAGAISMVAGHDIRLGTAVTNADNDVRADQGVTLTAGRDIVLDLFCDIASDNFGNDTGGGASANATRDFRLGAQDADASFGADGAAGADVAIAAEGSVSLGTPIPDAVFSLSGSITIETDSLVIVVSGIGSSGITALAATEIVHVLTSTAARPVDLGSTTDLAAALEISDAEVDRIVAATLVIESQSGALTVTQAITRASGALDLVGAGAFGASGAGSLSAPDLSFTDSGSAARAWTVDASDVTVGAGAAIPYALVTNLAAIAGPASDTFDVVPSATTAISVEGNDPTPPATPGDSLTVDLIGTTTPSLSSSSTASGFQGSYTFGNRQPVAFSEIESLVGEADLEITKTDGVTEVGPGDLVTYTIVVDNPSSFPVTDALVTDVFPAALGTVTWSCAPSLGSTCTLNGSGDINDTVDLAAGGSLTYSASGTLDANATGTLSNTASVTGGNDPVSTNNSATDEDEIVEVEVPTTTDIPTLSTGILLLLALAIGFAGAGALRPRSGG